MNPVTYLGRLPGNDVVLNSTNVSRRHAKLIVTDLGVTVHDLDSHNGIFLNGKKVRSTPVAPGDLLYIGDMCVELQRSRAVDPLDPGNHTAVIHNDISDEDDPRARSLATVIRAADLCAGEDPSWALESVHLLRELVEATVAVLVEVHSDGELETPVVLQPDSGGRGPAPVIWAVVNKAIETQQPQFTTDLATAGFNHDVKELDPRAIMAVPVFTWDADAGRAVVAAVLYLSRPQAGPVFTHIELETVDALGRLIGLRLERDRRPVAGSVSDDAELISARAKIMTVEGELNAERDEVRTLTERVHTLEGDNLRLRQQSDIERQGAQKQVSEREREALARLEASLVEQKKASQRDIAAVQKEVERVKGDLEKQKENARALDEDRRNRATEAEKQKQRAKEAEDSLEEALAGLAAANGRVAELDLAVKAARDAEAAIAASLKQKAAQGEALLERSGQATTALRNALRQSMPPMMVDHVEAVAAGEASTTAAQPRQLTVVYLALADFDAFCERAPHEDVRGRLDRFVGAVAARVPANGGRIDQVVGHGHLVVFEADPQSVRAAVRCALEVAAIVDAEAAPVAGVAEPAVVGGIHVGTAIAGFFGGDDAVSYVEAGLPVVVARAAVEHAPPGSDGAARGIIVSEAVRAVVGNEAAFRLTRLGPTWIKGAGAPVHLALVEFEQEGAA